MEIACDEEPISQLDNQISDEPQDIIVPESEEPMEITDNTNDQPESLPEPAEQIPESPVLEAIAQIDSPKPKSKNKKKSVVRNSTGNKSSDGGDVDERRVTFGKRYIKSMSFDTVIDLFFVILEFSKTTTNLRVSSGTIKQQEIKSILKHNWLFNKMSLYYLSPIIFGLPLKYWLDS